MKAGDLVRGRLSLRSAGMGIVLRVIVNDANNPERNTVLVQWHEQIVRRNGVWSTSEKLNVRLLEVISASR